MIDPPSKDPGGRCERVLVVEDSDDNLDLMRKLLERTGHTVETARNGAEAIDVAKRFEPHAVLIDIGLPGLDGFQVAIALRKLSQSLLLVAVTGRSEPDDHIKSEAAGFDYHLTKPINFSELMRLLNEECVES
jgi:CheY-like chemotaxis protein